MTWIIGIDPGTAGAIAVLDLDGRRLWLHDIPFHDVRRGRAKSVTELAEAEVRALFVDILAQSQGDVAAAIELQSPRPFIAGQDGMHGNVTSIAKQVGTYACLRGLLTGVGIVYDVVPPSVWKKAFKLSQEKDDSRHEAGRIFPLCGGRFAKGRGRPDLAEAALIAAWSCKLRSLTIPSNIELVSTKTKKAA